MTGVVLPGERRVDMRAFGVPEPGPGQVLIRMKASGLCGSDLRAIYRPAMQGTGPEAYSGVIAGHEPAGQIVAVGQEVRRFRAGDRVAVYHIAGCGLCHPCRAGWMISCKAPSRAAYGWQRDGGHAEFLLAEERTLVSLPQPLSYLDGANAACGLGTAYAACVRAGVSGRDRVLITGLGPVGLGLSLLCRAMGADVVGIEAIAERRQLAARLGVALVLEPHASAVDELIAANGGEGVDVAIDCSGNGEARRMCLAAARDWGRVVFVGEGGSVTFEPSPLVIHKQLSVYGSWVCSIGQMEDLLENLVRWQLHSDVIVTHRYSLEQAADAYKIFDTGQTGKVAIVWNES
jgi:threonine dehydrogenase-like Zn-dependent dehydrogenase